jgi:GTP-binding protein
VVSFRRESKVPRGGPDGGDGGRGGAIVFRASASRNTLVDFRFNKVYRAPDGKAGAKKKMSGPSGEDLVLLVPIGTIIHDATTDEVLADLTTADAEWRLEGGRGGRGNQWFATATHQTPIHAQPGEEGVEMLVRLELKLIADVGLVGFPNAGKSTLISRISAARPKIADYPFTTLVPNLGVVDLGEGRSFVVADLPGLIEGAADGAGLGHRFLRHLGRCRVLVHLVAGDVEEDPVERVRVIERELEAYDPELAERPRITILSKVDVLEPEAEAAMLARLREAGIEAEPLSAVSGKGLRSLLERVWRLQSNSVKPVESPDAED